MPYGSETWSGKDEDVIRLERNNAGMIRWIKNVGSEDRVSAVEFRTRLKLNDMRKCLQD